MKSQEEQINIEIWPPKLTALYASRMYSLCCDFMFRKILDVYLLKLTMSHYKIKFIKINYIKISRLRSV